ncbi:MAG: FMN-dependent alpha-hydroxy acid dehydrogenase [Acidobacteria bacterium]|nr:FMN-dependent alpha-hydroxy acid dehydrogenase [Acidobacteriota bacterium]
MDERHSEARREFLKFLVASPYVAALGGAAVFLQQHGMAQSAQESTGVLATPADALSVLDFEETARKKVNPGHWAYMASGVDDDATLRANREVFKHIQLRPRRLHDPRKVDTTINLFGTSYASPIYLCPTGGEKSFNRDGELAVARAARARNTLQILSTASSTGVEEVNRELGRPAWYQVYAPNSWEANAALLKRVEAAGCPVIALTVDNITGRNSEFYLRTRPKDLSQCTTCHPSGPGSGPRPMTENLPRGGERVAVDWALVDNIRKTWKGKFFVKGIDTREDARLCVEHGLDGIMVSNHGGRATETIRSTVEALPEVVAEVRGRIPVYVDGGFRRGTDIFKALALGATAVGIGRPFLWGLGAFGQAGVDRVLEILQGELKLVMGNCGTQTLREITPAHVATPDWKT